MLAGAGSSAIPGSVGRRIGAACGPVRPAVVFVTNNSSAVIADPGGGAGGHRHPGGRGRVDVGDGRSRAGRGPGERVLVGGGPGITEAVTACGAIACRRRRSDRRRRRRGAGRVPPRSTSDRERRAIRRARAHGVRLMATNDDTALPDAPDGPIPGGGAILASIATATGHQPVVAGKPYDPMADGRADNGRRPRPQDRILMVGDRAQHRRRSSPVTIRLPVRPRPLRA